jgi:hypothetical protein
MAVTKSQRKSASLALLTLTSANLNGSVQSNSTTAYADVPGLSVAGLSWPANAKAKITFSGRVAKNTAGFGNFIINFAGADYGQTITETPAGGTFNTVSTVLQVDLVGAASAQTAKIRFKSSDTNAVQISHGSIVVEIYE